MATTLLTAGIACIIAAIVGGGLKAFGFEIPALASARRQVALGLFGTALLAGAVVAGGGLPWSVGGPGRATADSPSGVNETKAGNCLSRGFTSLPGGRVRHIESGAAGFEVLTASEPKDQPVAVVIEERRQPVGAIEFEFFAGARIFKISRVVGADCQPIETFINAARGGDKHVLQDWDTVEMTLGADTYALRLGYADGSIQGALTRVQ
jgi:hypothetical protein